MKNYIITIIIFLLATLFFVTLVRASDTGAINPGTATNDTSVGTVAWSPVNGIKEPFETDGSRASAIAFSAATTNYAKATNFGFSIPAGATIDGIKVEIRKARVSGGTITDSAVRIVKADGSIGTTDRSNGGAWDTEAYTTYGDTTDLWGETWTAENINDADFGVAISAVTDGTATARIDHIRTTVYYTEGAAAAAPTPRAVVKGKMIINGKAIIK